MGAHLKGVPHPALADVPARREGILLPLMEILRNIWRRKLRSAGAVPAA